VWVCVCVVSRVIHSVLSRRRESRESWIWQPAASLSHRPNGWRRRRRRTSRNRRDVEKLTSKRSCRIRIRWEEEEEEEVEEVAVRRRGGWIGCAGASGRVSGGARIMFQKVPNRISGSRMRPPSDRELAISTSNI